VLQEQVHFERKMGVKLQKPQKLIEGLANDCMKPPTLVYVP
jgi:hypothetical protein